MKRVAVIGAGVSGLTATKVCVEEGLDPVCFERTDDIGGLWNFTPDVREGEACVMKSTITNTSKEMAAYSDFPPPHDFPMFLHNRQMLQYLRMYVDKFGLLQYIHCNTEVVNVKAVETENSSKWTVTTKDQKTATLTTETFDDVMVCSGHYTDTFVPNIPGLDEFQGQILHSRDYKDFHGFEDKKVVVVGIGNSAGDAAAELSHVASRVYMCVREGRYIFGRISEAGMPLDMVLLTRFKRTVTSYLPMSVVDSMYRRKFNQSLDHTAYCLEGDYGLFEKDILINDAMPSRIACGAITIKSGIRRVHKNSVEFDDGTTENDIDVILMATGYSFRFPFLDSSVPGLGKDLNKLYKFMFPPVSTRPTICALSIVQAAGPHPPIAEMQARLAVAVFKGEVTLPSVQTQMESIDRTRKRNEELFRDSKGHYFVVDYLMYMDELATVLGCRPSLVRMFVTDPKLALVCLFGPCTPYQYRLQGPGKWTGAREAVLKQWDRTVFPLKTRPMSQKPKKSNTSFLVIKLACTLVGLYYLCSRFGMKWC